MGEALFVALVVFGVSCGLLLAATWFVTFVWEDRLEDLWDDFMVWRLTRKITKRKTLHVCEDPYCSACHERELHPKPLVRWEGSTVVPRDTPRGWAIVSLR